MRIPKILMLFAKVGTASPFIESHSDKLSFFSSDDLQLFSVCDIIDSGCNAPTV